MVFLVFGKVSEFDSIRGRAAQNYVYHRIGQRQIALNAGAASIGITCSEAK